MDEEKSLSAAAKADLTIRSTSRLSDEAMSVKISLSRNSIELGSISNIVSLRTLLTSIVGYVHLGNPQIGLRSDLQVALFARNQPHLFAG